MSKQIKESPTEQVQSEFYDQAHAQQEAFVIIQRGVVRYQASGRLLDEEELNMIAPHEPHLVLSVLEEWLLKRSKQAWRRQRYRRRRLLITSLLVVVGIGIIILLARPWASHSGEYAGRDMLIEPEDEPAPVPMTDLSVTPPAADEAPAPGTPDPAPASEAPSAATPATAPAPAAAELRISLGDGYFRVQRGAKWGLVDSTGREVLPARYDQINRFQAGKGLFLIEKDGRRGIANTAGEVLLHPFFDEVTSYFPQSGYFVVAKGGKQGVYDGRQQQFALGFDYAEVCCYSEGLFGVRLTKGWGFADRQGRLIIPAAYDAIVEPFHNGQARVRLDGREFYIDLTGEAIANRK